MFVLPRRVFQDGGYVVFFQIGIVRQDLVPCSSSGEELENIRHTNPQTTNARTSAADVTGRGDSIQDAHDRIVAGSAPARSAGCRPRTS